jgi:hypothetical protein
LTSWRHHAHSFNDLVGAGEYGCWNVDAQRPGGLHVDHKLVFGRSLDRQVSRLFALEDAIDVAGRAPILVEKINTIRDQAPAVT